jgi:hypothetical protein
MRADNEDETRDGAGRGAGFDAAVGARHHADAEVREGLVGARGAAPTLSNCR